jgi:serine/threonine protein kinase
MNTALPDLACSRPLAQLLVDRPRWPCDDVLQFIRGLAEQVAVLHRGGQTHREIDIDTVHVGAESQPLLGPPPATRAFGGLCSEPDFCPPELADRDTLALPVDLPAAVALLSSHGVDFDPRRIDVYQLGVLCCRLLTGQSLQLYLYSPSVKAGVAEQARALLDRSLGYDDLERLGDCESLIAAIDAALGRVDAEKTADRPLHDTKTFLAEGTHAGAAIRRQNSSESGGEVPLTRLGTCRIVCQLGQGGMGDVYKAHDESLDRVVAVKVLPPQLARDADFVRRFRDEASAVARLMHPNVVQIHSIGEEQGHHYFVMQFVEGESVADYLHRAGRFEVPRALAIVEHCLAGLAAAHDEGLIHRDIKPGNVLLDAKSGRALIADFGLVKRAGGRSGMTATGVILGTVNYLSPEQARGLPVDARSDLYSIGVLLYELVSGELPFQAESATAMIFQHAYEPPRPLGQALPHVPPDLARIVDRLLRKNPDERYQTALDVQIDLRALREGRPVPVAPLPFALPARGAQAGPAMLAELAAPTEARLEQRLRDRVMSVFDRRAPRWMKDLQGTALQVDGAIDQYRRRREKLARLAEEARHLVAELAEQLRAYQEAMRQAEARAASAASTNEAKVALQERKSCEEQLAALTPQLEQQQQSLADVETKLAQADATLVQLRSQRDLLEARLKAAHAGLRVAGAKPLIHHRSRSVMALAAVAAAGSLMLLTAVAIRFWRQSTQTAIVWEQTAPPPDNAAPINASGLTFTAHRGAVLSASFAPLGGSLVSGGADGSAVLWDASTGMPRQILPTGGTVRAAAFSPQGDLIATGGADGQVRFWPLSNSGIYALPALRHDSGVRCLAFGPGLGRLTTGDSKGQVTIWDYLTGTVLHTLAGHKDLVSSVAVSPDKLLVASTSWDGAVRLWNAETGAEIRQLVGHSGGVDAVRFSHNGRWLATGSGDHTARLWNRKDGKPLGSLPHPSGVGAVAFRSDTVYLATGCNDGALRIFDVESQSELVQVDAGQGPLQAVDFSADGQSLVTAGLGQGRIRIWSVSDLVSKAGPKKPVSEE